MAETNREVYLSPGLIDRAGMSRQLTFPFLRDTTRDMPKKDTRAMPEETRGGPGAGSKRIRKSRPSSLLVALALDYLLADLVRHIEGEDVDTAALHNDVRTLLNEMHGGKL